MWIYLFSLPCVCIILRLLRHLALCPDRANADSLEKKKKRILREMVYVAVIIVLFANTFSDVCGLPSSSTFSAQRLRGGAGLQRPVAPRHIPKAVGDSAAQGKGGQFALEPIFDAASISLMVTLVKTLLGSSILTLSGGLAVVTDVKLAWIPAVLTAMAFALLSAYTYCLIGTCCHEIGATSYNDLWSLTISASSAWIPTTACVAFSAIACQVYTIVMRDIVAQLVTLVFAGTPAEHQRSDLILRRETQLVMLGAVMLPLCLLRTLTSLAKVGWVGMGGVVYLAAFMSWRCFTGAYLPGGTLRNRQSGTYSPIFGTHFNAQKVFYFLSLLHGCYQIHYDAPRIFGMSSELSRPLERFRFVTCASFSIAGLVGAVILAAGYLTFGSSSKAVILGNYDVNDSLATMGSVAVLISLMSSYPLVFNGFYFNMLSLGNFFSSPQGGGCHASGGRTSPPAANGLSNASAARERARESERERSKAMAAVMLVVLNLLLGLVIQDIGFICALAGSLISGVIIFVFPPIFHMRVLRMRATKGAKFSAQAPHTHKKQSSAPAPLWTAAESALWYSSFALAALGIMLCVVSVAVNLKII